ncbi:protein of unknown function DUF1292 [Thalassoporum mexicanum PCC 7367]|uniref:DUF3727 domain-containing protein n=1 Tax=Thalassoporum mexicanum TaxID=3457544 RepID=UPI00029F8B80|nr:DUF3727 domain-containing protein [Pseudanabaena sp. PCC 7367]AFY68967.1 protein of unknown function DUF1292 [Pseudanabaena sp. PCC 7367]
MNQQINLTDEKGRTLECFLEATLQVDQVDYLLLQPINHSVQIFAWAEDDILEIIDETEEDQVFSTAQAVLAEQDLKLHNTAYTLTVTGALPEVDPEEIVTVDTEEEGDCEEFQELAHFYYEEQEYSVLTAIDPLLFFAKKNENDTWQLLSSEELQEIEPYIEEHLIETNENL